MKSADDKEARWRELYETRPLRMPLAGWWLLMFCFCYLVWAVALSYI